MYSIKVINILCLCQKSSLILNSLLLHIIRLYVATYLVGSNSVKHVQTIPTTLMAIHRTMPAFPDFADAEMANNTCKPERENENSIWRSYYNMGTDVTMHRRKVSSRYKGSKQLAISFETYVFRGVIYSLDQVLRKNDDDTSTQPTLGRNPINSTSKVLHQPKVQ